MEKHSDVLGRTATWKKTMQISSLPKYLCVQVGLWTVCDVVHAVLLEGAARESRGGHRLQDHARGGVPLPLRRPRVLHDGGEAVDRRGDEEAI